MPASSCPSTPGARKIETLELLHAQLDDAATTLARIIGHADAGFSLKAYAEDASDESAVVTDVLARAATAQIGG